MASTRRGPPRPEAALAASQEERKRRINAVAVAQATGEESAPEPACATDEARAEADETYHGVGILPPLDVAEAIDRYRARYDGIFYERTVPHITVKQPFRLLGQEAGLLARVQAVCQETAPFPVEIGGVDAFGHRGLHVVYLRVRPTTELLAFRQRLGQALADLAGHGPLYSLEHELRGYLPHVTLGQGLTAARLVAVRAELAAEGYHPAYLFQATAISVARCAPDLTWRRPYRVHLGTGEVAPDPYPEQPPWPRARRNGTLVGRAE